jgi:hypothetical protein
MAFVSVLAAASAAGVWRLLAHVPLPPKITLAQRIRPVADPRVALTLLCTWLYQSGHFIIYTYFTVVFDRAIGHSALLTGVLPPARDFVGQCIGNMRYRECSEGENACPTPKKHDSGAPEGLPAMMEQAANLRRR